jgi:hypothetical protein
MLTAEQAKQSIYLICRKNREPSGTLVTISWTKTP